MSVISKRARWHVLTAAGKPIADLFVASKKAARRHAQRLADQLRVQVRLTKVVRAVAPKKPRRAAARKKSAKPRARARGRKNPGAPRTETQLMDQARRTFRMWHDFDPSDVVMMKPAGRTIPRVLVKLGEIPTFVYSSDKWTGKRELYEHATRKPYPVLCTGPDGKGLYILGGRTRVTERGLVD